MPPAFPPVFRHTRLIGVGHKARQGKDLAVAALEAAAPGRARRFSFADALYIECMLHHGMTVKDPKLLQDVGWAMRTRDPDIWVRTAFWLIKRWDDDARGPQVALIPDVRFPNEAAAVLDYGGHLLKVQRFRPDGSPFIAEDRLADHPSETALDDFPSWTRILTNDRDIPSFEASVRRAARELVPAVFGPPEVLETLPPAAA